MRQLFRQSALDALSSPEQLETLLVITPLRPLLLICGLMITATALLIWSLVGVIPYTVDAYGLLVQNPGYTRVTVLAPNDGEVTDILVRRDEQVVTGQVVARLSLSDSSGIIEVQSQYTGTVDSLNVRRGDEVRANGSLLSLKGELDAKSLHMPLEAVLYLPYESVQMVSVGMTAYVVPSGISTLSYGYMTGPILSIGQFPSSDQYARALSPNAPLVAVRMGLTGDGSSYAWTLNQQPAVSLRAGMQLVGKILIREDHPIDRLVRSLNNAR